MRRLGIFLLCLLSVSLLTTAMVHAQEIPSAPTIDCSGYVHTDGDADQTQGDADKAMPHHHGSCHGGTAFVPAAASDDLLGSARHAPVFVPAPAASKRWAIGPDLRPPIS
ncbi:MAG TPA: hypothetical protein VGO22_13635 [Pseudorhizobium sp.]|jgi:hypothetical protein|nr:hypothetical protein [Pseudorhizobium sp.]